MKKRKKHKVNKAEKYSKLNDIMPTNSIGNNPNLNKSENMEVHHHTSHHTSKSWKTYLFDFFMLFLAVLCGTLAEYKLEHIFEEERANKLAKDFYYELYQDSISASNVMAKRKEQNEALIYLGKYFKDSSINNVSKEFSCNFYTGILIRSSTLLQPRAVILNQLINSGMLRYFEDDSLKKWVGDLSAVISRMKDRQDVEVKFRSDYFHPFTIKHYDMSFQNELTNYGTILFDTAIAHYRSMPYQIPFDFKNKLKFDQTEAINITGLGNLIFRSTWLYHYKNYVEINTQLLRRLRENYLDKK